ncbi:uncharacterized protein [Acropora muricata]|uniref:uncharacterized protein n=1 Tax=Acropora muricata TaxID=159855 RepID=UPI0034E57EBD
MSKKSFLCCFCKEDDDRNKDNERKPLLRNKPKSARSPHGNDENAFSDDGSDFHERSHGYSPVKDVSEKPLGSPCRNSENAFSDGSDFYAVPEVSVKDGKPSRSFEKSASKSTADSAKGAEGVEQQKSKELELKGLTYQSWIASSTISKRHSTRSFKIARNLENTATILSRKLCSH